MQSATRRGGKNRKELQRLAELAQRVDGEISTEAAADDLVKKLSPRPRRVLARVIERIRQVILPEKAPGPATGN